MPDLVPNHSEANANSSKTQDLIGSDDNSSYSGHQIHHLINPSISTGPHPVAHLSHMNVSSQHSSATLFDQVQGMKFKNVAIIAKQDIIYLYRMLP